MAYVTLALLVLVVLGAVRLSSGRGRRASGCCAPPDPRDDMRMRAALEEDTED